MPMTTIETKDGSFEAYLARPAAPKAPGIVLIQEIFGVNKVMRDLADGFAAQGYVVACPDLFWRQQPGVQLTDQTDADWQQAMKFFQGFDIDKGVADLDATLAFLRAHPACTGKVGPVGYCLGGKLAYLTAARTTVDAAVGYYGVAIDLSLNEAQNIKCPLMLHIAEKDQFVPPPSQRRIHEVLDGKPGIILHDYPGMDHAFARVGGAHYNAEAAKLANDRTAAFFKQHLS
jgi:carboxymethylenebutenolidase